MWFLISGRFGVLAISDCQGEFSMNAQVNVPMLNCCVMWTQTPSMFALSARPIQCCFARTHYRGSITAYKIFRPNIHLDQWILGHEMGLWTNHTRT